MISETVLTTFGEGSLDSRLVDENGRLLFSKCSRPRLALRSAFINLNYAWPLQLGIPLESAIDYSANHTDRIKKEVKTLRLWEQEDILASRVHRAGGNFVTVHYIPDTVSCKRALDVNLNPDIFERLMDRYTQIRDVAKRKRNSDYLHSDPTLVNFLYDYERDLVVAIDPGTVLNPSMDFDTLDAHILARTLRDVANIEQPEEDIARYVRMFKEQMSEEDVARVTSIPHVIPEVIQTYFEIRDLAVAAIKGRKFVDTLAPLKTYCARYHAFIEDILLE
ncbi:hypothetical protein HN419_05680 [Candidatus Woesearchaeota archaeon]|jgi:tRNA A-37 threonylcarbamoyl transferase component Bud32|nr:hypothetical protein [Candidatus Woesearchaeota archaeon]MBT3537640.1 hypothetical protein [Candidatus Woesearchaeota archaeon]MBT4698426.1 hypothetical protein [Candidatus Woesearchaeota archaeon]MBT4716665.1 hypothetical protein [Candidatus Woesearchaeota archaeon]MBT7105309.1 hypothetical protein [Candidatus Woesearchaeota archaeon]